MKLESFWEGKEPDFQASLERRQVGLKQETVESVEVRGREPEQGSICVTGVLDELGLGSDTQIQQPLSRASQTSGSSRPQGAGPPTMTRLGGHIPPISVIPKTTQTEGKQGSASVRQDLSPSGA